jgi:hypothetical protein
MQRLSPIPMPPMVRAYALGSPCLTHTFLTSGMPTTACTTTTGNCVVQSNSSLLNGNVTLSANTQIHVVGGTWGIRNQTVNLSPGTYWVTDGDLQLGPGGGTSRLECLGASDDGRADRCGDARGLTILGIWVSGEMGVLRGALLVYVVANASRRGRGTSLVLDL